VRWASLGRGGDCPEGRRGACPGNNMKRTPLCGRNFEYYSEDPLPGGEMAASLINGVQSKGVGTSLKHYAANNKSPSDSASTPWWTNVPCVRFTCPLLRCGEKGQAWTVMCAYNKLNGTYCSEHHELAGGHSQNEWGFEGLVFRTGRGARSGEVIARRRGSGNAGPKPRACRLWWRLSAMASWTRPS